MFLRKVYFTQSGGSVKLNFAFDDNFGRNVSALLRLLELLYCNQFVHMLTLQQLEDIWRVASYLGLKNTASEIKTKEHFLKQKLRQRITRDFQLKQFQAQGEESTDISQEVLHAVNQEVEHHLDVLETTFKYDFRETEPQTYNFILSPEEERDSNQTKALQQMKLCMHIDEFFDVVFNVDKSLIKANSVVLKNRSEYFQAMFS